MNIFKIYKSWLSFTRAFQIFLVLVRYVCREAFYRTRWGKKKLRKNTNYNESIRTTPQRLRLAIEELGPTFVKFGQILADRPDMISEPLRNEFKKLQAQATPLDNETAIRIIEDELGRSIGDVFSEFDRISVAAASIGQVYQGKLYNGKEVIIKIQRPRIEDKIAIDLSLMNYVAKRFVNAYPELAAINIIGFVDEFGIRITQELDYRNEANNALRFAQMFADDETVHVPEVYIEYTTRKLLVMEKIVGIPPDNFTLMHQNGYDTHVVAVNGANALLKMILEYGFFHADPHAGNIFIIDNNVIAFIDYGMVGVLRPREMNFLANFCISFSTKDARGIANALIDLCDAKFFGLKDELEFDIHQVIEYYSFQSTKEVHLSEVMQDCVNLIVKYKMQIPSGIFMLVKSLASLQKFAEDLDPDIHLTPIIMPYARRLILKKYNPRRLASEIYDSFTDYIKLLRDIPSEVSEILYKLKEGKIHHEILLQETDGLNKTLRQLAYRMASVFLIVGVFVGSAILAVFSSHEDYGRTGLIVSGVIIGFLLLRMIFVKEKR